ncbi:UDP-N-acetylmuramoyl-L-alanyl-D-glutamate--2,6-diaminopimelate ligase [bacterium]|nr:UDP-N-acetylmuramoyl-L-alanyl-D-glutamate--2,6-diaminopimelate ligase [bacterium]
MKLRELLKPIGEAVTANVADQRIRGLALDSRQVRHDFLFAVVPGPKSNGLAYVAKAVEHGAAAVLASRPVQVPEHVALILVQDVRKTLADLSCRFYGYPADHVRTLGVTGTNGKTTVATLVHHLLTEAGRDAALLSTVEQRVGRRRVPASNTTPEAIELQAAFADMVELGIAYAAMEVSSHSLDQRRVQGIPFAVAALTNLTAHEHLDYHGTFERYRDAKLRLFQTLAADAAAIINRDDPAADQFAASTDARTVTFGLDRPADVFLADWQVTLDGATGRLCTPAGEAALRSPLVGRYNVMNLLTGTACALEMGLSLAQIVAGLETFVGAPGRLERVDCGQPFTVFVDYAHNHDGLESVLTTLEPLTQGRLIVVFGAGGARDPSKRPLMGAAAAARADLTVLTADNSRSERSQEILDAIAAGMPDDAARIIEPDRHGAIQEAIGMARRGDVILIAGKGHEAYQELDSVRFPFDDRDEARAALNALGPWGGPARPKAQPPRSTARA